MDSIALVMWGIVFSSIGFGYFIYGKKQSDLVALICGILLIGYPYFVTNTYILILIGIVIMAIPYFLNRIL